MGLTRHGFQVGAFLLLASGSAFAIPELRLTQTVIGPVAVATGQAAPQQSLEIYNAGDGTLNPQFVATASWVQATTQSRRPCSQREGECTPVQLALNTQALGAGRQTATVRVFDSNAADAPQDILVIVNVGGGVPNRLDLYVAPGAETEKFIYLDRCRNSLFGPVCMTVAPTTQSGGNWLSLALDGEGSFRFNVGYRVIARHLPGMQEGAYQGSVSIRDAQFAADNKTVPVTLRVTSQPIADAGIESLRIRAAQGSRKQTQGVAFNNRGGGTLALSGATAAVNGNGAWLSAERVAGTNAIAVSADPAGLNQGVYTGSVSVSSNAANASVTLPVVFEIVPAGPPAAQFQGVANNANFFADEGLARGLIAAAFGEQFIAGEPASATALPLPTQLGGAQVFINDRPAPMFFSSYGQINFQVPFETQLGEGLLRIDRGGQRGNSVSIRVAESLPRLLRFYNGNGLYGIVVNQDGTFPVPASLGIPNTRPAKEGDTLVMYAIGLGQTDPPVATGAAAAGAAVVPSAFPRVLFGSLALPSGVPATPLYVGLTPGFVGLYQINVTVPPGVTPGDVPVRLQLETIATDYVLVSVQ